jgi:hypothetical protein
MSKQRPGIGSWLVFLIVLLIVLFVARPAFASDVIFADGFGEESGGALVCDPPGPRVVETFSGTTIVDWGGTQSYASLPEVGVDQFTMVRTVGGQWRAYLFTVADAPGVVTWNGDTSNTGGFAGARERWFSVSECEGDFTPRPFCYGTIGEGPWLYTNFTGAPVPGTCPLDPAKTYYLSIHAGAAPCSDAGSNLCSFRIKHQ